MIPKGRVIPVLNCLSPNKHTYKDHTCKQATSHASVLISSIFFFHDFLELMINKYNNFHANLYITEK